MGRCVDTVAVKVVYSPFMTYSSGNRESTPSAACARHPAAHRGLSSLMATAAATAGERRLAGGGAWPTHTRGVRTRADVPGRTRSTVRCHGAGIPTASRSRLATKRGIRCVWGSELAAPIDARSVRSYAFFFRAFSRRLSRGRERPGPDRHAGAGGGGESAARRHLREHTLRGSLSGVISGCDG